MPVLVGFSLNNSIFCCRCIPVLVNVKLIVQTEFLTLTKHTSIFQAKQSCRVFLPGIMVGDGDVRTINEEEDGENAEEEKALNDQDDIKVAL